MATPITITYNENTITSPNNANPDNSNQYVLKFATSLGSTQMLGTVAPSGFYLTSPTPSSTPGFVTYNITGAGYSSVTPFGYIPKCATNIHIILNSDGMDDDLELFTQDGKHVFGTKLTDFVWKNQLGAMATQSTLENNYFTTANGFNAGAKYDASALVNSNAGQGGKTLGTYGNITLISGDNDSNNDGDLINDGLVYPNGYLKPSNGVDKEEIAISSLTENLILMNVGQKGGSYALAASYDLPSVSYGITGGTLSGTSYTKTGSYGTLTLNTTTGTYSYTPNNISTLKAGTYSDTFDVYLSLGSSCPQTTNKITVNITATDDKPTTLPTIKGTVYENAPGKQSTLSTALNITDPDGYTPLYTTYDKRPDGTTSPYGKVTLTDANNDGQWEWVYTLNPGVTLPASTNGIVPDTIEIPDITDKSGNNKLKITVDIDKAPTVKITSSNDNSDMKAVISNNNITFTFSEVITDFTSDDIIVKINGVVTPNLITTEPISPKGSNQGIIWTATFTPPTGLPAGSKATIQVKDKSYVDGVSNTGSASDILTLNLDTQAPTVTKIESDKTGLKAGETAKITFTFSESVIGFDSKDDIVVTGGKIVVPTNGTPVIKYLGNNQYEATFEPESGVAQATIRVKNKDQDASYTNGFKDSNENTGINSAQNILTLSLDSTPPTLVITTSDSCLKIGETATITFDFDEEVTGFTLSDAELMTTGVGTISSLSSPTKLSTGHVIYTATFTPTTNLASGTTVLRVDDLSGKIANPNPNPTVNLGKIAYTDLAGNPGTGNAVTLNVDTVAPTVVSITPAKTTLAPTENTKVTIVFSEAPPKNDITESDIAYDLNKGTLSNLSQDITDKSGKTYTAIFTASATATGTATLQVKANSYHDAYGNDGTASAVASITIDPPLTVTITSDKANNTITTLPSGDVITTVTFKFNKDVEKFDLNDVTFTDNATGVYLDTTSFQTISASEYSVKIITPSSTQTATCTPLSLTKDVKISIANTYSATATAEKGVSGDLTLTLKDGKPPVLLQNVTTGNEIILTYDETLNASNPPPLNFFTLLTLNGVNITPTKVTVKDKKVILTLSDTVYQSDQLIISYSDPAGDTAQTTQDCSGNDADSFDNQVVINKTLNYLFTLVDTPANDTFGEQSQALSPNLTGTITYQLMDAYNNPQSKIDTQYGLLKIDTATGKIILDSSAPKYATAINALTQDAVLTYKITAKDTLGNTQTGKVEIDVTAANDPTEFSGTTDGEVTEDGTLTAKGILTLADRDAIKDTTLITGTQTGIYGTFVIDAKGAWKYTLNNNTANVQALNSGEQQIDKFTVTTSDGSYQEVVILVNGKNEPVLVVSKDESQLPSVMIGYLDTEGDDNTTAETFKTDQDILTTLQNNGSFLASGTTLPAKSQFYIIVNGKETKSATGTFGTLSITGQIEYYYKMTATTSLPKINALLPNEVKTDTFIIELRDISDPKNHKIVKDSNGNDVKGVFTVTFTGANDKAEITLKGSTSIIEDSITPLKGTYTITDRDANSDLSQPVGDYVGLYGTLTLAAGKTLGAGNWTYTLDNSNPTVQALNKGDTKEDKITVTAADGSTQDIIISIKGVTDTPENLLLKDRSAGGGTTLDESNPITLMYGRVDYAKDANGDLVNSLVLTYNKTLDALPAHLPDADIFTLMVTHADGTSNTIAPTTLAIKNNQVILTLDPTDSIINTDQVSLIYKDPTTANNVTAIQDSAGVDAPTLNIALSNQLLSFIDSKDKDVFSPLSSSLINPFGEVEGITYSIYTKAESGKEAFLTSLRTDYGTFSINKTTGDYTFTPNNDAINALPAGAEIVLPFEIHAINGKVTQPVQVYVRVSGADDLATFTAKQTVFNIDEGATRPLTGAISIKDVDSSGTIALTATSGNYGNFLLTNGNKNWSYSLDNTKSAVRALTASSLPLTDSITIINADGSQLELDMIIHGKNSPGVITGYSLLGQPIPPSKAIIASITEGNATPISGALTLQDDDSGEDKIGAIQLGTASSRVSNTPVASDGSTTSLDGLYGRLMMNNSGQWSYQLDNANPKVQALLKGESLTDTFGVYMIDGQNPSNIKITINGVGDNIKGDTNKNQLNDNLTGSPDGDLIDGGKGNDTMAGGLGDDTYILDNANDQVIENPIEGNDTMILKYPLQDNEHYTLQANVENVTVYLPPKYAIVLEGNAANNVLMINAHYNGRNDTIKGGAGNDILRTSLDTVQKGGPDGNDSLDGGEGNDILFAGVGNNTLTGGKGADAFVFDSYKGVPQNNTINDFNSADGDKLRFVVQANQFKELLDSTQFSDNPSNITALTRIIYDKNTGKLSYDADGNGSTSALEIGTLLNKPTITANDIQIVGVNHENDFL